ncbi:MAG: TerC family protein [Planctomycetales bacterium]|nr:TerC family protein [Planctomycetales bacterium]
MLAEIAAAITEPASLLTHLIALVALTLMEIVLGIDNIVFISVVTSRLPEQQQASARRIGLAAAMGTRILLLLTITWIMNLKHAAFSLESLAFVPEWAQWLRAREEINEVSWKDIILVGGGLFLINSSVREIHAKMEGEAHEKSVAAPANFRSVIFQIAVLDIIFSLDSVITAVGMAEAIWVMITAVVLAVAVMMVFSGMIARFVERHLTVKMLALSFLLLIGVTLVADGLGTEISKGYIYFAMGFALLVEVFNLRARAKAKKRTAKAGGEEHPFVD